MEFLGSLALHRMLQTELPPPIPRPDGAQAGCDRPSTHCKIFSWLAWQGITWLWQQEESQQRPVARPCEAPGSGVPALCKPRAAHSSLLRRARQQLWRARCRQRTGGLSSSAALILPWQLQGKLLSGGHARVSLERGPGSSPGCLCAAGWQQQSKQQRQLLSLLQGRCASGLATSLFVMH